MVPFPGVLFQVLCVAGYLIVFCDGETVQRGLKDYTYTHRAKRGMSPAIRGALAWRTLLWNSKPIGASASRNAHVLAGASTNIYKKAGDFADALNDFSSVVPNDVMTHYSKAKGKVYEGTVGDRRVILRQRGLGDLNIKPTIEIVKIKEQTKDIIVFEGKYWNKGQ